jgi:tetratricopeptide (TPR) repeat protein
MKKLLLLTFGCLICTASFAQKTDTLSTASGIKYYFIKKGNGPALIPGWLAIWNYKLTLTDGTKVDATADRGVPFAAEYPKGHIIKGVTEALSLMHIGDDAVFILPPNLAYGEKGWGKVIPPNATLIFDMELIDNKQSSLQTVLDSVLFGKPADTTITPHIKEALATYHQLKKQNFGSLYVTEEDLNDIGYELMAKYPEASVEFLKLNAKMYPKSWNVYDSLGDGYKALGKPKDALKNYEKAVKMNPKDSNGQDNITKLKAAKT